MNTALLRIMYRQSTPQTWGKSDSSYNTKWLNLFTVKALVQGKRDGLMAGPVVHAVLLEQNVHKKVSLIPTVFQHV